MHEFSDKSIIVTGGASGIGRAVVEGFAAAGATVYIADLDSENAEMVAQSTGDLVQFIRTDVTDENDMACCIDSVVSETGRIDCIVNNVGIVDFTNVVSELDVENARRQFEIHLLSVIIATKLVVPRMQEAGGGVILNTTSVRGVVPSSSATLYAVMKAGVIHWTKSVSQQLAADNIRINCVSPGAIPTPLTMSEVFPDGSGDEEGLTKVCEMVQPLQKVGDPNDIAAAMLFLAGKSGQWVTGQNFVLDGGYTAMMPIPPSFET